MKERLAERASPWNYFVAIAALVVAFSALTSAAFSNWGPGALLAAPALYFASFSSAGVAYRYATAGVFYVRVARRPVACTWAVISLLLALAAYLGAHRASGC